MADSDRDPAKNQDLCPAKPEGRFADHALDVTFCRTIFPNQALQSPRRRNCDHNGLKKG
jgi:hypothetical protein